MGQDLRLYRHAGLETELASEINRWHRKTNAAQVHRGQNRMRERPRAATGVGVREAAVAARRPLPHSALSPKGLSSRYFDGADWDVFHFRATFDIRISSSIPS